MMLVPAIAVGPKCEKHSGINFGCPVCLRHGTRVALIPGTLSAKPSVRGTCVNRGEEIGMINCGGCGVGVKIKTFACNSPDVLAPACTLAKPQPGLACCQDCSHYAEH